MHQGLTVKGMEELHDDIKMHLDLDRATPTHVEFWEVLPSFLPLAALWFSCLINRMILAFEMLLLYPSTVYNSFSVKCVAGFYYSFSLFVS